MVRKVCAAKQVWRKMGDNPKNEVEVAHHAVEMRLIAFDDLPEHAKEKDAILQALEEGSSPLLWCHLNNKRKADADYALAALKSNAKMFKAIMGVVEDKERLWIWVRDNLDLVPDDYWRSKAVPEKVCTNTHLLTLLAKT